MIPSVMSSRDAASVLGLSEQRVRTLLRSGVLEGRQLGKQWLTTAAAVEAYRRTWGEGVVRDRSRPRGAVPNRVALSFFSGAMGLDLGLERAGIEVVLACESDEACRRTISANRPEVALLGDVWNYSASEMRLAAGLEDDTEIDVIVGGPPCQAFSTAGARRGFNDERGNVFLRFLQIILELRPRYAVIENVRGILSAPMVHTPHASRDGSWKPRPEELPGGALLHVLQVLREGGYGVTFNLYNTANFGVPQSRERVVLLCARDGARLPHLAPTHSQLPAYSLPPWRTLRDALEGMESAACDHAVFPEDRLRFYRLLNAGQYWKHLPTELHKEALGASLDAGGGKTGFLRRLSWDKPSCTLVTSPTMPATDICHPDEDRPLSIQEYKRIQQFPDDWKVSGVLAEQYRQIGNAVPVGFGQAVGRAIVAHLEGRSRYPPEGFPFSRYSGTDEMSWEANVRRRLGRHDTASGRKLHRTTKRLDGPQGTQMRLFIDGDAAGG